ncbi:MAG: FAD-dependent oxidoreductase, partial [Clostridia bacterium]|nr:FAD-dependent oxidoreductase [Clostridia bacterium]
MKYDFLIVGAGLFGAVIAREAARRGKKCLVIEKRGHIGGNCYTENAEGITLHKYGAHIFHTSDRAVWEYVNGFAEFAPFINRPLANYRGKLYHLPFNMNTFYALWGVSTPQKAKEKIASQIVPCASPKNVREQALSLVGRDIYKTLIEGYTEKQRGRSADKLHDDLIKT